MTVVIVCGVLVLVGLATAALWGGVGMGEPPGPQGPAGRPPSTQEADRRPSEQVDARSPDARSSTGSALRRLAWRLDIAIVSGLVAGVTIAGAGGRLAMRLLAATAGDAAQGRLTEAEEVVGRITTGGTIEFIISVGLFSGLVTGILFLVLRRWLPGGRLGGLAFGAFLLVGGATRLEPLRADNPDFDLVGPPGVALVVFAAVVVVHGMVTAAVAGRLSRSLPLLSRRPAAVLAHLPLVLLLVPSPLLAGGVLAAALAVSLARFPTVAGALGSRRALVAGRVVVAVVVAASLPGFVAAVADIAGRGP